MSQSPPTDSFAAHLQDISRRTVAALAACRYDGLLLQAGEPPGLFLDDQHYPFHPHPPFKAWVPLADAAGSYLQAAAAFRTEGATLKAIAAFKKVLKCDPTRYEVYRHLGDLNVERGLTSSAVQDYLTLGKYYLKERRAKDALEIYKKIIAHDPSNLSAQQRVAELCLQENQQDEATKVYLQLGREKSAQGRYDEAKDAYLAVLKIDPKNSEAAQFVESLKNGGTGSINAVKPTAAASALKSTPIQKPTEPVDLLAEAVRRIAEKQYSGAEAILNQLLTREPGNPQVCQLLARLHLQRGDVQVAVGEYRFLAGAAFLAAIASCLARSSAP